jgi:glycosyltransferase involved in cell wall biosynthesis
LVEHSLDHLEIQILSGGKGYFWEQATLPSYTNKHEIPLLNLCNMAPVLAKNSWITIHDLAFVKNKGWFSFPFRLVYNFIIPKIVKRSKKIFTVSNTIKKEIIDEYQVDSDKLNVVYNKVSEEFLEATPKKISIPYEDYFIVVGSVNPRKNYEWLCKFFDSNADFKLVIVGGSSNNFRSMHKDFNNVHWVGFCDVSELKWLYINSKGFINFSLYEGFGIPTIEAMSVNKSIICSDIPVNREVGGDEVTYIALNDSLAFEKGLRNMSENKILYDRFSYFSSVNRVEVFKRYL